MPNGPINDIAQVFEEPQVKARGVRIELEHAAAGRLPLVASPMRFSGYAASSTGSRRRCWASTPRRCCAACSARATREIARLRAAGVI